MKILMICYDLKQPGRNYDDFYKELKNAEAWWHYLESCWLVKSSLTPNDWAERLKPHIDGNDLVLVIEVGKNYQGWLPEKAWEWIRTNIG